MENSAIRENDGNVIGDDFAELVNFPKHCFTLQEKNAAK